MIQLILNFMRRWLKPVVPGLLILSILLIASPPASGQAQAAITASQDQAEIQFPGSITFSVELLSQAEIQQVTLEYHVQQVTCGEVIAIAFPEFTRGKAVTASWTWEMKQSGSLPPGAKVYWLWRVTDSAGNTLATPQQSITWLDKVHDWQTLSGENANLHWYDGDDTFGQELLDAAEAALANLEKTTGLSPEKPIDLYIYANTDDMRQAVLYEPGWTGGQAYSENDIVIIGISAGQIDWGKGAIAHELTHVLVGHLTFTCLGYLPGWLVEGLAMYGQGGPDDFSKAAFAQAVSDDKLISVQALSGGFSENPDQANISYSESYSLVNYLIDEYGKDAMLALLKALKEGATVDGALKAVYGFDINGFEDAWRAAIGAQARQAPVVAQATPTATQVPTIEPASAAAVGPTIAPTRVRATPEAQTPTATTRPQLTASATATRVIPTQASKPFPTAAPDPKKSSPSWFSGGVRIITSGGVACLILAGVGLAFFFAVIRPPRRRRKL